MRRLAAKLGVPVPTLYNHVGSKKALLDLVVDHILEPVQVPGPEEGSWEVRMRRLQRAARAALQAHPGVLPRDLGSSREGQRLARGAFSILTDGGFAPRQASQAFLVLFTFMLGQRDMDVLVHWNSRPETALLGGLSGRNLPPGDEQFEFAFDVLLAGLAQQLVVAKPARRASGRASTAESKGQ